MILTTLLAGVLGAQDVDVLLERLDDEDVAVRAEAYAVLRERGEAAIPALEGALGHASPERRGRADELLQRFPPYALRALLRMPEMDEVRRLWTAVVEAVIWKRPLPASLGEALQEGEQVLEELREAREPRKHSRLEILAGLREAAWRMLPDLLEQVGLEGAQLEISRAKRGMLTLGIDFLPLVLAAEPDATSFEEIYGTLQRCREEGAFQVLEDWSLEDWGLAVRLLVQLRRRPGAPRLGTTRDEILEAACRGPILRGIADALGRAFANRRRVRFEQAMKRQAEDEETDGEIRRFYGLLLGLDRWIGMTYYDPLLLSAARAEVPLRMASVPEGRRALFDLVNPEGEAARRVTADLLSRAGEPPWGPRDDETAARLLRALAAEVAAAAAP